MRLRFLLGYAVVAAIATGSLATALVVHDRETKSFERTQRGEAARSARQAEALARLSVGQLSSAAAFYRVEGTFSRHEFDAVARSLLRNGALSATAFLQAVRDEDRTRFERNHGYPIARRGPLGDLHREGDRESYFPLVFADTRAPLNVQVPVGYDVGSDPLRTADLLRARDTGRPAATRVIRLSVGGTGINVFGPVYRDGAPTATVAQRRAALAGFATGAFQVADLTEAATTALPDEVEVQLLDRGRTVLGPQLDREEAAAAPFRIADRTWLLVVRDPNRPGVSLPALIAVVGLALAALLAALVLIWSRNERMQELTLQASHDPLTGLRNRRRFGEDLRTELARSRREKTGGAVLMLDLDNFKQVNDTLGHPAGDRVIADIAAVLEERMRATDVVARLGGDEFAIVLPRCELDEAEEVAEAIAKAIRLHPPPSEAMPPVTASIGIATFGPETGAWEDVLTAADHALYRAKRAGRDSVRVAAGPAAPDRPSSAVRAES
ncbi:MAG TPA: diguanylate cyclase [Solirubrobacterales bacterium]|jgi:diguanylate cyclase (GGDEF)-like protein|nr:diguanylate cyclase [Solirubrobacterales bacterium]